MRILIVIATVFIVFFSCSKEPILDIREGMTFDPDTIMLDSSLKGWELYSWNSGTEWRYSLLPGTNRVKNANEIYANPYTVNGREQLKLLIRSLPSDEDIVWLGTEWTSKNVPEIRFSFIFPSLLTQYDIHKFCELNGLQLEIVP
jgi:hypothetical protein